MKNITNAIKDSARKPIKANKELEGDMKQITSTGSTLLDLAISGGRKHGGGLPSGILVEIFGPSGAGKTVMLCEIAGNIQKNGGEVLFRDPEARLNMEFAKMFGMDPSKIDYDMPDTVPEVFKPIRLWQPDITKNKVHGIFADSLAALSTEAELSDSDGYGMRRAKEFSEQLRLTCRTITQKGYLMVCSNQIRQIVDAKPYGPKFRTPGGESIGFYASVRLKCNNPQKVKKKVMLRKGKEAERVIGVETQIEVYKNSVWSPYRTCPIFIMFDYGIDDIRANLIFIKETTGASMYTYDKEVLSNSLDKAIAIIENEELAPDLRLEVIELWEELEDKFVIDRRRKH